MRIQLFSDLHLERYPDFQPQILPGTDVVVLAGDIGSYQPGSRLLTQDFGLERFSPFLVPALAQAQVLFIPGNHACKTPAPAWASPGWIAKSSRSMACASSAPRCGATSTRWWKRAHR
jgi:hypothetical protein